MRHASSRRARPRKHPSSMAQIGSHPLRKVFACAAPQYPNQEVAPARRHARCASRDSPVGGDGGCGEEWRRRRETSGWLRSALVSFLGN